MSFKRNQLFPLIEAFARVAMLDALLVMGLYILRNRGWRSWMEAIVGFTIIFYLNGRIMTHAFARAFPQRKLPKLWDDDV